MKPSTISTTMMTPVAMRIAAATSVPRIALTTAVTFAVEIVPEELNWMTATRSADQSEPTYDDKSNWSGATRSPRRYFPIAPTKFSAVSIAATAAWTAAVTVLKAWAMVPRTNCPNVTTSWATAVMKLPRATRPRLSMWLRSRRASSGSRWGDRQCCC